MSTSSRRAYTALGVVLAAIALPVLAATFNLFSPATGILKGNASTYVTTAATSTDVVATFSGTCNASAVLKGDGSCAPASTGTVTSVGLTMPSGFSVANSPVTTSGTLAVTTTLNGLLKGNGSGFTTAASSDVISLWSGTCNASSFLRGDGACAAGGGTPAGNNTDIQYNNSGAFGAEDAFAYDASTNTLTAGDTTTGFTLKGAANGAGNSKVLTIIGGQPGPTNVGGGVIIDGGPGGSSTGFPGSVTIRGGTPVDQNGGTVSIIGAAGVGTNRGGGGISLSTGAPTGGGTGGSITLATGGTGGGSGGQFSVATGGTNRFVIGGGGDWQIPSGTPGTSGQVLTSNGTGAPPTWQTASGGALSAAVATINTNQSFADNTETTINFPTEATDQGGWHDNVTNNSRLTVPSGITWAHIYANVIISLQQSGTPFVGYCGLRKNGSSAPVLNWFNFQNVAQIGVTGAGNFSLYVDNGWRAVTAGDYFELRCLVDGNSLGGEVEGLQGTFIAAEGRAN